MDVFLEQLFSVIMVIFIASGFYAFYLVVKQYQEIENYLKTRKENDELVKEKHERVRKGSRKSERKDRKAKQSKRRTRKGEKGK